MAPARRAWIVVVAALLTGAFYLLLIDTTSLPELYVLGGVALAGACALLISREQGFTGTRIPPRWLFSGWRVLVRVPADIARLCCAAVAQLLAPLPVRGTFRAVGFTATRASQHDAGRRALTEWIGSVAPNTIVIGIDEDRSLLLVHQLSRQGSAGDVDPLRL